MNERDIHPATLEEGMADDTHSSVPTDGGDPASQPTSPPSSRASENSAAPAEHRLDFKDPMVWVVDRHLSNIIMNLEEKPSGKAAEARREIGDDPFRISFAELQRMRLRILQCKLVGHAVDLRFRQGKNSAGWDNDLRDYVQAMRDYDFMQECSQRARDPFYVTAERLTDDEILQLAMRGIDITPHRKSMARAHVAGPWETERIPIGGTRRDSIQKTALAAFMERLGLAVFGGAFLVGPMWIMVLHNSRNVCLISTTVLVTVFGLVMAWTLDKNTDVLTAVSAYAAVLVVFVGLAVQ